MDQVNVAKLIDFIKRHEGFIRTLYKCPAGHLTIGYGHNCESHEDVENYRGRTITEEEAYNLLLRDISEAQSDCVKFIRTFPSSSNIFQFVLLDMTFNMGIGKLLKFTKMFSYLNSNDKVNTAREMINSHWCSQVGRRATELIFMILTSEWI